LTEAALMAATLQNFSLCGLGANFGLMVAVGLHLLAPLLLGAAIPHQTIAVQMPQLRHVQRVTNKGIDTTTAQKMKTTTTIRRGRRFLKAMMMMVSLMRWVRKMRL
jgi:hypothetical protein